MKDFFLLSHFFLIFFFDLVFGVFIKNEAPYTKPPPQVEELPWLTFFDHPRSDYHREDVGRRGRDRIERQYVGLTSYSTLCPPGETGQFHYPPDCKRFINCWKGRGSVQVCAPGTLFNPETSECDFPGKVKCADGDGGFGDQIPTPTKERYVRFPHERPPIADNPRIARKDSNQDQSKPDSVPAKPYPGRPPYFGPSHLKPPTRPINQTGQGREVRPQCAIGATGLYPHPYDCTKFLKCWSGNTFIQNCGPGTFFNPLISACDHPRNVPCTHEEGSEVPFPDDPGVVPDDIQIPEESVQYEQYQDVNQGNKGGKKTIRPSSPSDLEPLQSEIISSTPETEIDDLEPSTKENSTNRKPKIINIGSSHKQVSTSAGKEPAHYLTPPQYDVYGNLINSNSNNRPLLGVQPGLPNLNNQNVPAQELKPPTEDQSGRPNINQHSSQAPKTPPDSPSETHPFLTIYPPQGPYAMNQLGNFPTKNYYGYVLNKQQPYHHLDFPHRPHHFHHSHHPYHLHVPTTHLQPPSMQHYLHYAPQHPFYPKTDSTYVIPQSSVNAFQFAQNPYHPIVVPDANPCVYTDDSNRPSAPQCEPGMSFYQPNKYGETSKPLAKPTNTLLCSKSPSKKQDPSAPECEPGTGFYDPNKIDVAPKPSISSQVSGQSSKPSATYPGFPQQGYNSKPMPDSFLSNYPQQGGILNPQYQPGYVALNPKPNPGNYPSNFLQNPNGHPQTQLGGINSQPNTVNYYPPKRPQTPQKQPASTYDSQSPSNFPQSSNTDVNNSYQPGFFQNTQTQPYSDISHSYQPGSSQITQSQPNSGNYHTSDNPQISSPNTNPSIQYGPAYDPQSQPNPPNINPFNFAQSPDTSTHPQNRPGAVYSPQYNFLPNFYPQYPGSYQSGYYPGPNAQTQPNYSSNIHPQTTPETATEKGRVPLPDPFPVTDKTISHVPEGQVQVPDPFHSLSSPNNYGINRPYPVYTGKLDNIHPTKESENIQGSPSQNIISVAPPPATFPPFPGNTEKPNKPSIKTPPKVDRPKDYILDKIDLRSKPEKEDVESIPSIHSSKDVETVDRNVVKENAKPSHTHPNKYSKPEFSDSMNKTKTNEIQTTDTPKKVIKAESDLDGYFTFPETEAEKPIKVIQKPYVRVKQTPPSGQVVRLRNGASHLDGYLEMKDSKSKWGLVCDESGGWEIAEATVACRELGFIRGAELSWQGYPIKSDVEELLVAVNGLNCTGNEASLSECNVTYSNKKNCDIGRNAVGLRCYDNLASHCQPGEILYNQHCYKLHGKENPDDPGIKTEEASEHCKIFGGKLVDITSQYENDFISEWLIKKHPEVTSVATGGIGISVLGRPMWLWQGTSDPMVYERWWSGWSGDQNIPKGSINGPLCIVLKKTFSCSDSDDESQTNVEPNKEETCSADYFFWDVEDCDKLRTSVYICERPMDDIGCVVGNGEGYVGTANTTASGQPCLPWDHPKVVEGLARRGRVQERSARLSGHNFCRNLGNPDRHPWCFVEGRGNSEYCAIPRCWDSVSGYSRSSGSWASCDQNHFECKPGECIKKNWVCDGQKDCTNGRDEEMCKAFIREFTTLKDKKMKGKGIEKWAGTNENMCAKLCLEKKNFKCRSYSYNVKDRYCFLSDTNIGLSGGVVASKGWIYHELSSESVKCTLENGFYGCHNGKCVNVSNVCDGKDNCGDKSDESYCERLGYEIRLAGSQEKHVGRVEVKILGKWGVICDDRFDLRDAEVVCHELGFKLGAAEVLKHSHFPVNKPLFLIDHLDCLGNETSIRECSFPGWGKHNCGPDEVVGIACRVSGQECPEGQWQCKKSKECILTPYLCDGLEDCDDKTDEDRKMCTSPTQIRLAGGPNATAGRLEIRHFDTWGTVCHDDFSVDAANAVCRMLGFNGPSTVKKSAYFGAGKGPIWLDNGQCFDNETDLAECKKLLGRQNNCRHDEDVSVICSQEVNQKSPAIKPIASSSSLDNSISIEEKVRQVLISECNGKPKNKLKQIPFGYEKVIGGSDVIREVIPWQASIRVKSGGRKSVHWCGAVVISPYHLLTASHCLRDYKKAAYFIRVGDYDTEVPDPHERELEIEHLYMHPNFSKNINLNNDIGLVKIKGEIFFGDHIKPACLVPSITFYQPGVNCSISGWGSVSAKSAGFARTLRRAFVPILEPNVCRAPFVYGESLSEGMFCAGQLDGGVDSCQGDSGGPLMCQYEGKEYLFGITSWGHGCGRANKPGVYTNVAHYAEWIQKKIQVSLT